MSLEIGAGKKPKLRPGDILGPLTSENGIDGKQVGKITLYDNWLCVAVRRSEVDTALDKLGRGKVKGRSARVRLLE
ncbi:DbpA RNA binding domain-containing protein [Parahaliea mediterranea]|uniref:DbpA RNA binding domain-containing protein n=1 Tax=Parahaliea mediterranea TaxID=651086 RepID=UPI0019D4DF64|nr:DbpA RNA binding domain-containing protein [Parahaliea mediterranea]